MSKVLKRFNFDENNSMFIANNQNSIKENIEIFEDKETDILEAARKQADILIENAKRNAQKIILNAKEVLNEERNQMVQQIKDETYNEAKLEADKIIEEANQIKLEAELFLKKTKEDREKAILNLEEDIVKIIQQISKKILTDKFEIDPNVILLLVKNGLDNTKNLEKAKIYVSENQYETLISNKDKLLNTNDSNNIEILKDISLKDSECKIETEFGNIICALDDQLCKLKENLYYILKSRT